MRIVPYITFHGDCGRAISFYQSVFPGLQSEVQTFGDCREQLGSMVNSECETLIFRAEVYLSGGRGDCHIIMADSPTLLFLPKEQWSGASEYNHIFEFLGDSEAEVRKVYDLLMERGKNNRALTPKSGFALYGSLIDQFGICWNIGWRGI